MTKLSRWPMALAAVLSVFAVSACGGSSGGSGSASNTLVLACYSASIEAAIQAHILPAFEKQYHASVSYLPGTSSASIAKIEAEKSDPQIDVACLDPGPQAQAHSLGLLQATPAAALTHLGQLYDVAKLPGNIGVAWALNAVGIAYDAKAYQAAGLAPPVSWNDLANPKLKNHLIVPDFASSTYAADMLGMLAKTNGGSIGDIQPGFAAMQKIKHNVITFDTTGDLSSYFQEENAWAGIWSSDETQQYIQTSHLPVKFVFPSEGAPSSSSTLSVVKGAPNAKLANEFLNYMISPAAQEVAAQYLLQGPVNMDVKLTPGQAKTVIYGPSQVDHLLLLNNTAITANLPKWTSQWNQTVENR